MWPDYFFEIFGMKRVCNSDENTSDTGCVDKKLNRGGCGMHEIGKYVEIGYDIGKLTQEKNEAYGDSWVKTEQMLKVLYPHGVPVMAYQHLLLTVRVLDKICRIATNPKALGESPWKDIAGYGILGSTVER